MTKLISGIWKFNDTITMDGWASYADATKEYVNFTTYKNDSNPSYKYIGFNLQHYNEYDNLQYLISSTTADRSYVWAKPSTATYDLGWQYEQRKIVNFGKTAQYVSDVFYDWFTANATKIFTKFTKLYLCDIVATVGSRAFRKLYMPQLAAPTLSLDGSLLTVTDESKKAETFSILANGEQVGEVVAKSSTAEGNSVTSLSCSIDCAIGDTVVVAIATRDTLTLSNGWTLISTSGINSADTTNGQRLSWAYKIAESTTETITVTQASAQRLYINMIALTGEAELVDNGYVYNNDTTVTNITITKPSGWVLWGMTAPLWATGQRWGASSGVLMVSQDRISLGYDATDLTEVTFECPASSTAIFGYLTVRR